MSKRVLIYSHVALWEPHHATTIEIAMRHHDRGDEVIVLSCFGDLRSCPANPVHKETACSACRSQSCRTIRAVLPDTVTHIRLHLEPARPGEVSPDHISMSWLKSFSHCGFPVCELVLSQLVDDARVMLDQVLGQLSEGNLHPEPTAFDHLKTFGIIAACEESNDTGRPVEMDEFFDRHNLPSAWR